MTEETLSFGSKPYLILLVALLVSRAADFLSTWIATPNLVLEANPIAKRLGWKMGMLVNLAICLVGAAFPVPAIMVATTSCLVAARNFQSAWIMRTMGEVQYSQWFSFQIYQTRPSLFLFCTLGQVLLTAGLGTALFLFSHDLLVPLAIGLGMIGYAAAVLIFTLLATWRILRNR